MLSLDEKINLLHKFHLIEKTYTDSFKGELFCISGNFENKKTLVTKLFYNSGIPIFFKY